MSEYDPSGNPKPKKRKKKKTKKNRLAREQWLAEWLPIDSVPQEETEALRQAFRDLSAKNQARIIDQLSQPERHSLLALVGDGIEPDVFLALDDEVRADAFEWLGVERSAAVIAALPIDDAVEIVEVIDESEQQTLLEATPEDTRLAIENGLGYPENSAGRLMLPAPAVIEQGWQLSRAIDHLRAQTADLAIEDAHEFYVVDGQRRVVGRLPVFAFIRSGPGTLVRDVMDEEVIAFSALDNQADVAMQFRDFDLLIAPVVDEAQRLLGIIAVDDVLDVIDEEAEADLLQLAGVARPDLYQDAMTTARSRASWLGVNLATAVLASLVIALFEETLGRWVMLAVLMPIVASMGGNAGTQSMTVTVRAIAMQQVSDINALRLIGKEALVGVVNGLLLAVLAGAVVMLWFGNLQVAIVISVAMVLCLVAAGVAGTVIPLTLDRVGIDPATASTVLLTTVTDVVGFLAFLGLAALLMG